MISSVNNQDKVSLRQTILNFASLSAKPLPYFLEQTVFAFKKLDDDLKILINYFIDYSERYEELFMSQSRISRDTGIPLSTLERKLSQLRSLGLIISNYYHMRPCEYKLAKFFFTPRIMRQVVRFFPALVDRFLHIEGRSNINRIYIKAGNQLINIDNLTVHKLPTEIVKAGAGIFAGARAQEKKQPKRERVAVEKNIKSQNLSDQVKKLTGRTLTLEEAGRLLLYSEAEIERAVEILRERVAYGTIIGNAFSYLSHILSSPAPVFKKREQAPSGANKTAQQGKEKPLSPYSNESLNERISIPGQVAMREVLKVNNIPSKNESLREALRRNDAVGVQLRKILKNSTPSGISEKQQNEENCYVEAQKIYIVSKTPEEAEKLKKLDAKQTTAAMGSAYMNQVIANWMSKSDEFKETREKEEVARSAEIDEAYTEQECNLESMRELIESI